MGSGTISILISRGGWSHWGANVPIFIWSPIPLLASQIQRVAVVCPNLGRFSGGLKLPLFLQVGQVNRIGSVLVQCLFRAEGYFAEQTVKVALSQL